MTENPYRGMKPWQLQAALRTNVAAQGQTEREQGLSDAKRALMSASVGEQIRLIKAEIARQNALELAKIWGVVLGIVGWLGGAILGGYFFGGRVFAAVFWSGLAVMAVGGVAWWIHSLVNRPSR